MGLIFDTSVLIDLERKAGEIEQSFAGRENEPFGISTVTAAELLHGVHRANNRKRRLIREAFVERVLLEFPILPFDLSAARTYAGIWAGLAKKGIQVGAHDLMIASTAISLGYSILTSNLRHYSRIEGLSIESLE